MEQHKWHKEIKAWADGHKIQVKNSSVGDFWVDTSEPSWLLDQFIEYRVKKDPVIEVKYFEKLTDDQGHTCYVEFTPDLEKWDMKITYVDGYPNEVLFT